MRNLARRATNGYPEPPPPPPPTVGPAPTVKPTENQVSFFVQAESTDAVATAAVDTGYKPPNGHAAGIDGKVTAIAETGASQDLAADRNTSGVMHTPTAGGAGVVDGFAAPSAQGNVAITGFAVAVSISGAGTLQVVFTPPGGFVGKIRYLYLLNLTEN